MKPWSIATAISIGLSFYGVQALGQEIAQVSSYRMKTTHTVNTAYLQLSPPVYANQYGNPLYILTLYLNGKPVKSYYSVTGRAYSQNRNRNLSGTKAPLPDGRYRLAHHTTPGTIPEVGGEFLPITPLFQTKRTQLGIHYDPSFNRNPYEDGTDGCVALISPSDRDEVFWFIKQYKPQFLDVIIGR